MKILVTCKRIPDPDVPPKVNNGALDLSGVKWVPNEFDKYAMETALRLAEHVGGSQRLAEIVVLSICPAADRQHITYFLAMGGDRAILVDAAERDMDSQSVAKLIAAVFKREQCDLLIAGKLSQDDESTEVPQRVAGLLDVPQASFAATVDWNKDAKTITVAREVDEGVETKRIPLPAVLSVDLRIVLPQSVKNNVTPATHAYNEGPRLNSLRGITMAKKKKVDVLKPSDLGVEVSNRYESAGVQPPPARKSGQRVASVEELVEKLATEAKVL